VPHPADASALNSIIWILLFLEKEFFCLFLEKKRSSSGQAAATAADQQELLSSTFKFLLD
jgi:hypothetical protein